MLKTEILCENCDRHFIIVTHDDEQEPIVCPFCTAYFNDEDDIEDE